MRRFSRRRRGGNPGDGRAPIDAARWLGRIREEGVVPLRSLEVVEHEAVPASFAAVGRGEGEDGQSVVVAFAPRAGGDALLAGLATAQRLAAGEGFAGELVAVAPQWSSEARRRLGLVKADLPFQVRAVAASVLADGRVQVEPEVGLDAAVLSISQVAGQLADAADRELFLRAAGALEGLASKHAGCLRGAGRSVELVLLARRVAELRADPGGPVLHTLQPQRATVRLSHAELSAAFDGLEGQLRKLLNDRALRDGEEGLRTSLLPLLASALGLRGSLAWPLAGSDSEAVDLVGVDRVGQPVVVAARTRLGLPVLGAVLDAIQRLRPSLPVLLAPVEAPVSFDLPRLVLAAQSFEPGVEPALAGLSLAHALFEIRSGRERAFELASLAAGEASRPLRAGPPRPRRPEPAEPVREPAPPRFARAEESMSAEAGEVEEEESRPGAQRDERSQEQEGDERSQEQGDERSQDERGGRGRSRRRRRRGGRGDAPQALLTESPAAAPEPLAAAPEARPRRFEEFSLFDLEEPAASDGGRSAEAAGRGRRGRSRRRGRRSSGDTGSGGGSDEGESTGTGGPGFCDEEPDAEPSDRGSDGEESGGLDEALADLPEELGELSTSAEPEYVEEDLGEEDEADAEERRRTLDREQRRRARKATALVEAAPEPPKPPRRRAVVVAHADRDSLLAAVLLARDIRLLEGLWVYPQADLMTFFRSVATDLREDVPIYLVGFSPSPARDVIQAATLYRGRITWFDHHDWPPEDLDALRQALGAEAIHLTPGAGSSLPAMIESATRRSRFSDKLVDLATGRFTQHDYERWGRLWWARLREIAGRTGDVRSAIDPLITGRPSDLAREAAAVVAPPVPPEVEFVTHRDFRLVHFAGHTMVVLEAAPDLDLLLAARIARERYAASLSLAHPEGSELFLLGGEETSGRRVLDFGGLAEHLAAKLEWVEALPDTDHVARFRIRRLALHPERLDEVIGEIAMGRSILER